MVLKPVGIEDDGSFVGRAAEWLSANFRLVVNVKEFGAVGNGTTDDTAAVSAAIAYANSLNPGVIDAVNVIGTTIFFPVGRYKITSQLTAVVKSGVDFRGSGENGTTLLLSYNGATFRWGTGTSDLLVGGGMADLKLEYLSTPGASATAIKVENGSRLRFKNLLLVNIGMLLDAGVSAARFASSLTLESIRGYCANIGRSLVKVQHGAGLHMSGVRVFVGGVAAPTINRTSTMTTVAGSSVVQLGAGSWDTVQITDCFFERFDRGVDALAGAGVIVNNIFIANTYFDYIRRQPIYLESSSAVSGGVFGVRIMNTWFASWEESGVHTVGVGQIRGLTIIGGQIASAGSYGINLGGGVRDVRVSGIDIQGVNRMNVNGSGILLLSASHVSIEGVTAGQDSTWAGFAWQAYNGVYVLADMDNWSVTNCDLDGTAGGITLEANASGSTNRLAHLNRGNIGYDGFVALTLPASAATTTNTSGAVWDIHVHGGTVTAIAKNGTTITGMTQGHLRIGPGETFALTYTGTPTVSRFVQP